MPRRGKIFVAPGEVKRNPGLRMTKLKTVRVKAIDKAEIFFGRNRQILRIERETVLFRPK